MSQALSIFDKGPNLVYCNPAAIKLLNLPPELARPGTPYRRIMQHQVKQGALAPGDLPKMLKDLRSKPELRHEYRDASGTIVSVRRDPLASGGFVVLYNDVTPQREAEAALQENEGRYYAVVEDQTDLIARFTPDGTITFVNRAFCQFHDRPREGILGRNIHGFVHPADSATVAARFRRGHARRLHPIEHRALGDSAGQPRWLHRTDRAITGAKGKIREYQSVMRDVTDVKRASEHAQRASKLTTLGQIVAGVTHELNQPLNAAGMAAQNALLELETNGSVDADYIARKLESFSDSVQRMGAIVNHLRAFIRSTDDAVLAADPAEVVRRAVELVGQQLDSDHIAVVSRVAEGCPLIAAGPVDVEMVLINLFTNARDAIRRRHRTEVERGERPRRGHISVSVRPAPRRDSVEFHVRDNGGGIPEGLIPHVFDPFFTTKEVGEGMGLGLALVHQTVASFGGDVHVHNTGKGAAFRISVPAAAR